MMLRPKTDPGNIGPVSQKKKKNQSVTKDILEREQGQEQIGYKNAFINFFLNDHCSSLGSYIFKLLKLYALST